MQRRVILGPRGQVIRRLSPMGFQPPSARERNRAYPNASGQGPRGGSQSVEEKVVAWIPSDKAEGPQGVP